MTIDFTDILATCGEQGLFSVQLRLFIRILNDDNGDALIFFINAIFDCFSYIYEND